MGFRRGACRVRAGRAAVAVVSGEFGDDYCGPFFHNRIESAAEAAENGSEQITKAWGEFLRAFAPVARAISWCEASDSGVDYPLRETLQQMPAMEGALHRIKRMLYAISEEAASAMLATNRDRMTRVASPPGVVVRVPKMENLKNHEHAIWRRAVEMFAQETLRGTLRLSSYVSGCGDPWVTYHFVPWSEEEYARNTLAKLRDVASLDEVRALVAEYDRERSAA